MRSIYLICSLIVVASAMEIIWNSGSGNWEDPSMWNPSQVPSIEDTAVFLGANYVVQINNFVEVVKLTLCPDCNITFVIAKSFQAFEMDFEKGNRFVVMNYSIFNIKKDLFDGTLESNGWVSCLGNCSFNGVVILKNDSYLSGDFVQFNNLVFVKDNCTFNALNFLFLNETYIIDSFIEGKNQWENRGTMHVIGSSFSGAPLKNYGTLIIDNSSNIFSLHNFKILEISTSFLEVLELYLYDSSIVFGSGQIFCVYNLHLGGIFRSTLSTDGAFIEMLSNFSIKEGSVYLVNSYFSSKEWYIENNASLYLEQTTLEFANIKNFGVMFLKEINCDNCLFLNFLESFGSNTTFNAPSIFENFGSAQFSINLKCQGTILNDKYLSFYDASNIYEFKNNGNIEIQDGSLLELYRASFFHSVAIGGKIIFDDSLSINNASFSSSLVIGQFCSTTILGSNFFYNDLQASGAIIGTPNNAKLIIFNESLFQDTSLFDIDVHFFHDTFFQSSIFLERTIFYIYGVASLKNAIIDGGEISLLQGTIVLPITSSSTITSTLFLSRAEIILNSFSTLSLTTSSFDNCTLSIGYSSMIIFSSGVFSATQLTCQGSGKLSFLFSTGNISSFEQSCQCEVYFSQIQNCSKWDSFSYLSIVSSSISSSFFLSFSFLSFEDSNLFGEASLFGNSQMKNSIFLNSSCKNEGIMNFSCFSTQCLVEGGSIVNNNFVVSHVHSFLSPFINNGQMKTTGKTFFQDLVQNNIYSLNDDTSIIKALLTSSSKTYGLGACIFLDSAQISGQIETRAVFLNSQIDIFSPLELRSDFISVSGSEISLHDFDLGISAYNLSFFGDNLISCFQTGCFFSIAANTFFRDCSLSILDTSLNFLSASTVSMNNAQIVGTGTIAVVNLGNIMAYSSRVDYIENHGFILWLGQSQSYYSKNYHIWEVDGEIKIFNSHFSSSSSLVGSGVVEAHENLTIGGSISCQLAIFCNTFCNSPTYLSEIVWKNGQIVSISSSLHISYLIASLIVVSKLQAIDILIDTFYSDSSQVSFTSSNGQISNAFFGSDVSIVNSSLSFLVVNASKSNFELYESQISIFSLFFSCAEIDIQKSYVEITGNSNIEGTRIEQDSPSILKIGVSAQIFFINSSSLFGCIINEGVVQISNSDINNFFNYAFASFEGFVKIEGGISNASIQINEFSTLKLSDFSLLSSSFITGSGLLIVGSKTCFSGSILSNLFFSQASMAELGNLITYGIVKIEGGTISNGYWISFGTIEWGNSLFTSNFQFVNLTSMGTCIWNGMNVLGYETWIIINKNSTFEISTKNKSTSFMEAHFENYGTIMAKNNSQANLLSYVTNRGQFSLQSDSDVSLFTIENWGDVSFDFSKLNSVKSYFYSGLVWGEGLLNSTFSNVFLSDSRLSPGSKTKQAGKFFVSQKMLFQGKYEIQIFDNHNYDQIFSSGRANLLGSFMSVEWKFLPIIGDTFTPFFYGEHFGVMNVEFLGLDSTTALIHYYSNNLTIEFIGCPYGAFDATNCSYCPPGQYFNEPFNCTFCPPGTFSDTYNLTECLKCEPGFVSKSGSALCEPCPKDTFFSNNTCIPCPDGFFSEIASLNCSHLVIYFSSSQLLSFWSSSQSSILFLSISSELPTSFKWIPLVFLLLLLGLFGCLILFFAMRHKKRTKRLVYKQVEMDPVVEIELSDVEDHDQPSSCDAPVLFLAPTISFEAPPLINFFDHINHTSFFAPEMPLPVRSSSPLTESVSEDEITPALDQLVTDLAAFEHEKQAKDEEARALQSKLEEEQEALLLIASIPGSGFYESQMRTRTVQKLEETLHNLEQYNRSLIASKEEISVRFQEALHRCDAHEQERLRQLLEKERQRPRGANGLSRTGRYILAGCVPCSPGNNVVQDKPRGVFLPQDLHFNA